MKKKSVILVAALAFSSLVVSVSAQDATAFWQRAYNYAIRGDFNNAIAAYTQAIRLAPNEAKLYHSRGIIFASIGNLDGAIADLTQAIRLQPNEAQNFNERGQQYARKNDFDNAISDFTQAIKLSPNVSAFYINRGRVYAQKEDKNNAKADYEAALRIDSNNTSARQNLETARNGQVTIVNAESAVEIMRKFKMSDNCQDAIKRFPANLQGGFQGAYISMTTIMGQSDEFALRTLNSFLMINYMKTNIILQGKGNEPFPDPNTDKTFSQQYTEMRLAGIQAGVMFQMAVGMSGYLTGANLEIWGNRLVEWL